MTPAPANSLLVVDDEPDLRTLYELTLVREGYEVETAGSVEEAWALLSGRAFSAVITDMRLPDGTGLELLQRLDAAARGEKTIVITAYGSAQGAVEALKCGAYDYLTKPVDLRQFRAVVASALGRSAPTPARAAPAAPATPRRRAADLAPAAATPPALQRLVGRSESMQQVQAMVGKVARSMAPVLVQGESGTGKELVARAVHELSSRAAGPFGYRKGAFTGAAEDREGFFQAAQGGTLFLDEIGDLPLAMQSKLLRVIQERAVRPIGAVSEAPVNVRIVSATHRDLAEEVHAGRFRQDLYYRLNVICINLPPLRERAADLALICRAVLERIAHDAGVSPVPTISEDALRFLSGYAFPGNVRELENLLQRALALSGGEVIERQDLGLPLESGVREPVAPALDELPRTPLQAPPGPVAAAEALPVDLQAYLDAVERDILVRALERYRYNRTAAGASMGLSLRQMRYRMARLGVTGARARPSPNFDARPAGMPISLVVLHSISLPPGEYGGDAIEQLFTNRLDWDAHPYYAGIRGLRVSAHFLVRRDGALLQFVSCEQRAWHAGRSVWRGRDDCNHYSIGIELEGLEDSAFEPAQYRQLARLLRALAMRYPIDEAVGHEDVAPGRKFDPGAGFDWQALRRQLRRLRPALPRAAAIGEGPRVEHYR